MALSGILGPVAFGALTELDQQQQTSARITGDITRAVSSQALADINKRQKDLEIKEEYKSKISTQYGPDVADALDAANVFTANETITNNRIKNFLGGRSLSTFKGIVQNIKDDKEKAPLFDKFLKQSGIGIERKSLRDRNDFIGDTLADRRNITDILIGPRKRGGLLGALVTDKVREKDVPAATSRLTQAFQGEQKEQPTDIVAGRKLFGIEGDLAEGPNMTDIRKAARDEFKDIYKDAYTKRFEVPKEYRDGYNKLKQEVKDRTTKSEYAFERFLNEKFIPRTQQGQAVQQPNVPVSNPVNQAKSAISIIQGIENYPGGDEAREQAINSIKEKLKSDLNETDLSKYGL